jgi:hypothetical protein
MSEILLRRNSTQAVMPIIQGMSLKVVMKVQYIQEVAEVVEGVQGYPLFDSFRGWMTGIVMLFAFLEAHALPSHFLLEVT